MKRSEAIGDLLRGADKAGVSTAVRADRAGTIGIGANHLHFTIYAGDRLFYPHGMKARMLCPGLFFRLSADNKGTNTKPQVTITGSGIRTDMVNEALRLLDRTTVDEIIICELCCEFLCDVGLATEIDAWMWFAHWQWCKRDIVHLIILPRETEMGPGPQPLEDRQVLLRALIAVVMGKAWDAHCITFFLPPTGDEVDRHPSTAHLIDIAG